MLGSFDSSPVLHSFFTTTIDSNCEPPSCTACVLIWSVCISMAVANPEFALCLSAKMAKVSGDDSVDVSFVAPHFTAIMRICAFHGLAGCHLLKRVSISTSLVNQLMHLTMQLVRRLVSVCDVSMLAHAILDLPLLGLLLHSPSLKPAAKSEALSAIQRCDTAVISRGPSNI